MNNNLEYLQGLRARVCLTVLMLIGGLGIATTYADSLYVGDKNDNTVKRFDAQTGDYLGAFVVSSSNGGLLGPRGLIFTRGSLYVVNQNAGQVFAGEILQYRRNTGSFLGALVPCNPPLSSRQLISVRYR